MAFGQGRVRLACAATWMMSCTQPNPFLTEDTADAAPTDGQSAQGSCGDSRLCVSEPPAGWAGPVVWVESAQGDASLSCPESYPMRQFEARAGLEASEAKCECACDLPGDEGCGTTVIEWYEDDEACASMVAEYPVEEECGPLSPPSGSGGYWRVRNPPVVGSPCTPVPSQTLEPVQWQFQVSACGGAQADPGLCGEEELCVPAPSQGVAPEICVWQAGQVECPEGPYAQRHVRYQGAVDERGCSPCACSPLTGVCDVDVPVYSTENCSFNTFSTLFSSLDCTTAAFSVVAAGLNPNFVKLPSELACDRSGGIPMGEVEPAQPITLCCQPTQ